MVVYSIYIFFQRYCESPWHISLTICARAKDTQLFSYSWPRILPTTNTFDAHTWSLSCRHSRLSKWHGAYSTYGLLAFLTGTQLPKKDGLSWAPCVAKQVTASVPIFHYVAATPLATCHFLTSLLQEKEERSLTISLLLSTVSTYCL